MITPSFMELFREGNCRIYSVELPGANKQAITKFKDTLFAKHFGDLPSDTYVHCVYPNLSIPYLETGDIIAVKALIDTYVNDLHLSLKPEMFSDKFLLRVTFETMLDINTAQL